CQQHNNPPPTF
nr:immunoglobulin light chain junction region [Macaca mulatta]